MRISNDKNAGSGVNPVFGGSSSQDSHEKGLLRKISDEQKSLKAVEEDRDLSAEEKEKKKKEIQNQIKNLNSQLQQYRVRKKQEEAEKQDDGEEDEKLAVEEPKTVNDTGGIGVFASLEAVKERMTVIQRVRTGLEGMQRTAETEEDKEELQKKINNLSGSMRSEIKNLGQVIEDNNARGKDSEKSGKKERQQKVGEIFGGAEKNESADGGKKTPDKIFKDIRVQV